MTCYVKVGAQIPHHDTECEADLDKSQIVSGLRANKEHN